MHEFEGGREGERGNEGGKERAGVVWLEKKETAMEDLKDDYSDYGDILYLEATYTYLHTDTPHSFTGCISCQFT